MQKSTHENERLTLGPLPLEQRKKTRATGNYGFRVQDVLDGVFPIPNFDTDAGDIPSSRAIVSVSDIFWIVVSILTHLLDIGMDLNLARHYFMIEQHAYFTWTTIFLFIPSLVNIVVSIQMYKQDRQNDQDEEKKPTFCSKFVQTGPLWPIILFLQLAPVLRHIDTLTFAIKSYNSRAKGDQSKQKKYYLKMLKEEQDIALLRVLECFLEAAPHQVLQLTIMMTDYHDTPRVSFGFFHQSLSILSSLIGMGWAMSSYHRSIRKAQWDKENISAVGNWLQFFWHFFITISRVMTIAAAATILPIYTGVATVIHWLIMTIWIVVASSGITEFCRSHSRPPHTHPTIGESAKSYLLATIFGIIYIFTFFKLSDGPTYWKHVVYYIVCGIENGIASIIWLFVREAPVSLQWYYEFIPTLCLVPFILGIIVMVIYYKYFHPTMKNIIIDQQTENVNDRNLTV